jgi:hypothetical protein
LGHYLPHMEDTEPRDHRVSVMLTASELKAVEDWRRRHETIPTRSEACRRLIVMALKAEEARGARRQRRKGDDA